MNHPERYCGGPSGCLMMDIDEGGGDDHGGSYCGGGGDDDEGVRES